MVAATGQNVFFAELLEALADALTKAGVEVERCWNRFPPWRDDVVYVFVPHEYVPFVESEAHPGPVHLSRTIALCTEQPGTSWFEESASLAARAAMAVDINQLGMQVLRRRGIKTELMQLGYFSAWDTWGGEEKSERPVDVTFMGGYTPRRARALAGCASLLAKRRTELKLTESLRPHLVDSRDFLSGERRWAALRRSKLIVNVHRGEVGYFEWLRVVGAILNGCVVVTEHSLGFDPLIPGEHFVSVGYERLPIAIAALLTDEERIADVRRAAYHYLRDRLPEESIIAPLIRAVKQVGEAPLEHGFVVPPPVPPLPRGPSLPPTEPERLRSGHSDLERIGAAVKAIVLGQADLQRQISRLENGRHSRGINDRDRIERGGPSGAPAVSVLLTVYNYADVVGDAIASVAAGDFRDYELVIVEDASTDDSLASVRRALKRHPWVSWTILSHANNKGLAAARNGALEHARGDLVFILDADNLIYPHALGRLAAALDRDPSASFAYGMIERFGPEGPNDLMSWHGWDPARLRYGNYIDAMAMIRREALVAAGGYTQDKRLYGWEDFALWCAFASAGLRGIQVPEILTRYRTGPQSMISTTNIDTRSAWGALVERFPFLDTREPVSSVQYSLGGA